MEDKTKIDELFKQGLGSFTAEPPVDTWQNIQDDLIDTRRRKRIAFWRISGTAAALVLAFFSGYYFDMSTRNIGSNNPAFQFSTQGSSGQWDDSNLSNNNSDLQNQDNKTCYKESNDYASQSETSSHSINLSGEPNYTAVATDKKKQSTYGLEKDNLASANNSSAPKTDVNNDNLQTGDLAFTQSNENDDLPTKEEVEEPLNKGSEVPASALAQNANEPKTSSAPKDEPKTEDEPFVYNDEQTSKKKKRDDTRGSFAIGAVATPTFAFNDVSPQPSQQTTGTTNLGTTSDIKQSDELQNSYAAGLNLSYRTSSGWEVSTGLHLNNWSQVSSDVFLTADAYGVGTSNGLTARGNTSTGAVTYSSGNTSFDATRFEYIGPNEFYLIPDIQQQYQFLEVPVKVGYYLFESHNWSFKVQAGFSGRFLTQSDVKLVFEDGRTEDYDGLELKDFSVQLIGGTGLDYKATKNLSINITPSVQYGLTSVNKNSEIETYFHQFLVYTGLTYSF